MPELSSKRSIVPLVPASGDRRGGDRRRRGDPPLGLADDRAADGRARGADARLPRGEPRARRLVVHGRAPPVARRARRRARRRGDHELDHLARDRERDRPLRRDAGLRRRPRRHAEHRSRARAPSSSTSGRRRSCRSTSTASPPTSTRCSRSACPLVEDAAHAAESRYRGRKVGAIADLTCFSLYATKNIAAGEGGLIATEPRRPRRGARRPARDAPRPRLALRHRRPRLQGEPHRRARLDRARPARQGRAPRRDPRAGRSRSTTRASPTSTGIEPVARDPRDVHANHLYVVRIDAVARPATSTSAR